MEDPFDAVTVNVSVLELVAERRWLTVGVYTNAPVPAVTLTVPPPVEVVGAV